jgi:hypothetical protein
LILISRYVSVIGKNYFDRMEGQKEGQVWTGPALGGGQMKYQVFPDPFKSDAFFILNGCHNSGTILTG